MKKTVLIGVAAVGLTAILARRRKSETVVTVTPKSDRQKPVGVHYAFFNRNFGNIINAGKRYKWEITLPGNIFKQFPTWETGAAAFVVHFRRYITGQIKNPKLFGNENLNTIHKIIHTWAPSFENDTEGYIQHVVSKSGVNRNQIIAADDKATIFKVTKAMSLMESNQAAAYYTQAVFNEAWQLAQQNPFTDA